MIGSQVTPHAQMKEGLDRKARLYLVPPFHSLIMRLIHPVMHVTMLAYDLLSCRADGKIEPEREDGEKYCLKAANQHASVIRPARTKAYASITGSFVCKLSEQ